jgi:arginine decarboxylase
MCCYLIPKAFFVTAGSGVDGLSQLNAFDRALKEANLAGCNLVPVSSIIPPDAKEVDPICLPPGTIAFCVLSGEDGVLGELIGCGLGWGFCKDENSDGYGIVAEHHGHDTPEHIRKRTREKLERMSEIRGMRLESFKSREISLEVDGEYGSVVTVLVYVF